MEKSDMFLNVRIYIYIEIFGYYLYFPDFFMNGLQHSLIAYFFGYTFEKIHTFYDLKVCLLDPLNFDFFVCSTF